MIDILKAKQEFKEYVKSYLTYDNGKIGLKISHIQRVSEISKDIATKLNLEDEDIKLAQLIGLLHDIGRFEQVKRYNTFIDKDSINHGKYGAKILFEDGLIRKFIKDDTYDKVIYEAIINHNAERIPEGLTKKEELHSKIIRDADKTDIYYVINTEDMKDAYCTDNISDDIIKDEIVRQFKEERKIDYKIKENAAESIISHLAYVFDFNYKFGLEIIKKNDYINKIANRFKFNNKDTYNKIQECAKIANEFIEQKIKDE